MESEDSCYEKMELPDGSIYYWLKEEDCWKIKNQPKPTIEIKLIDLSEKDGK